jgi:hypothetical protein
MIKTLRQFLYSTIFCLSLCSYAQAQQDAPAHSANPVGKLLDNHLLYVSDAYPNPARDFVYFDYKIAGQLKEAKITVKNMLGSEVAEHHLMLHDNRLEIPISQLPTGIYFYTLSVEGNKQATKRFVVKHLTR